MILRSSDSTSSTNLTSRLLNTNCRQSTWYAFTMKLLPQNKMKHYEEESGWVGGCILPPQDLEWIKAWCACLSETKYCATFQSHILKYSSILELRNTKKLRTNCWCLLVRPTLKISWGQVVGASRWGLDSRWAQLWSLAACLPSSSARWGGLPWKVFIWKNISNKVVISQGPSLGKTHILTQILTFPGKKHTNINLQKLGDDAAFPKTYKNMIITIFLEMICAVGGDWWANLFLILKIQDVASASPSSTCNHPPQLYRPSFLAALPSLQVLQRFP